MKLSSLIIALFILTKCLTAQSMNVNLKTIEFKNLHLNYSVKASYPQVNFGPDALMGVRGIAQDINNFFDTTINSEIKDFETQAAELQEKSIDGQGSSFELSSESWITNGSILSSEITEFYYLVHMAHPNTTITAYNFLDNGSGPLTFSDLFKGDSRYLNFISAYCILQLSKKAEKEGYTNTMDMIESGASPDPKNYSNWTIKDNNLDIIFNPYQAGPYVLGIQRVEIPLSEMKSMINPEGALSFMLR